MRDNLSTTKETIGMAEHAKNTTGAAGTKYARKVQQVQKGQQRRYRQK